MGDLISGSDELLDSFADVSGATAAEAGIAEGTGIVCAAAGGM